MFLGERKKMTAAVTTRNRKSVIIYPLLLLLAVTAPLGIAAAEGASPVGLWENEDAKIEIFKDGEKLDGKIAALSEIYGRRPEKNRHPQSRPSQARASADRAGRYERK